MNALAKIYSWADGVKRRVSNPLETIGLGITQAGEDLNAAAMDADIAYGRNGMKSVLLSKQQKAEAAKRAAQFGEQMAMAAATVYHGSPHKFDKFDSSKIGTGEGAQAYGHGLYLAESPAVAKSYQDALAKGKQATSLNDRMKLATVGDKPLDSFGVDMGQDLIDAAKSGGAPFMQLIDQKAARWADLAKDPTYPFRDYAADKIKAYGALKQEASKSGVSYTGDGSLYKVDLPDDAIAKMLDWDKPLAKQPQAARDLFAAAMKKDGYESYVVDGQRVYLGLGEEATLTGKDAYRRLHEHAIRSGKARPAKEKEREMVGWLRNAGVPGIRYLDGGSRGAGGGTSNYVVFPGNESLLKILERNGVKP
jgi:hypothetical protein